MAPSADVLALATTEIDISKIQPGQGIKTTWRKQPVFVRNLTPKEIQEANAVSMGDLRDPQTLAERTKPGKANWLITLGVCTHLGCVPLGPRTTRPAASGRGRRRRTWKCRNTSLPGQPRSRSGKGTVEP
jgi:ubiquinol-cytochrome c reductase iron-sulfur subunit